MRIAVYAICRNEIKNIKNWVESMKEADEIVVLDNNSTDGSQQLLRQLEVKVYNYDISREAFRFDVARNKSLSLVSEDIDVCVCTDFDMILPKGWRQTIEDYWLSSTVKLLLPITLNGNKTDIFLDRVHSRHGFSWRHAIYETVENDNDISFRICNDVVVNVTKTKQMTLHDEKFDLYKRLLLTRMHEEPDNINVYKYLYELYKTVTDCHTATNNQIKIWV